MHETDWKSSYYQFAKSVVVELSNDIGQDEIEEVDVWEESRATPRYSRLRITILPAIARPRSGGGRQAWWHQGICPCSWPGKRRYYYQSYLTYNNLRLSMIRNGLSTRTLARLEETRWMGGGNVGASICESAIDYGQLGALQWLQQNGVTWVLMLLVLLLLVADVYRMGAIGIFLSVMMLIVVGISPASNGR